MPSISSWPPDPLILALDTSSSLGSVALWRAGDLISTRAFEADHGHSQRLLPAIDDIFSEARLTPSAVDLFAVVIGPGSFTGLRVSLASLRGLAGEKPCFGALATDAFAWAARGKGLPILAITDLFHGEVFGCVHDASGALLSRHESGTLESVLEALKESMAGPMLAVGSATSRHREALSSTCTGLAYLDVPEGLAPHLASLAAAQASSGTTSHASDVLPFYLRDPLTRGLLNTQPKQK